MIVDTASLQLRVWRPSRFKHQHMDINTGTFINASFFHEELYVWEPKEDILGAVTDVDQTNKLREALTERFSPEKPPETRNVKHLQNALLIIDNILETEGGSDWSDVEEARALSGDESLHLRQHCLLAFRQHIQWITDTFLLVPDVYITIR